MYALNELLGERDEGTDTDVRQTGSRKKKDKLDTQMDRHALYRETQTEIIDYRQTFLAVIRNRYMENRIQFHNSRTLTQKCVWKCLDFIQIAYYT